MTYEETLTEIVDWGEKLDYEEKNDLLSDDRHEEILDIVLELAGTALERATEDKK